MTKIITHSTLRVHSYDTSTGLTGCGLDVNGFVGRGDPALTCKTCAAKPLCRCGHPVATHDEDGVCRRRCGCRECVKDL